ncbi:cold-shock protein [Parapedobacter deserti]|uniref:Cold-shock protein n=1 Tax=Parapedobacter deserti TaxID=1912957 RepID=A0ABV7JIP5_9SPHI
MGRSQETFNKRENTKKRLQKKKEKQQRREDKKQSVGDSKGKSLDDMLAYVDENGNITNTPPDPSKIKPIAQEEIIIGVPKQENNDEPDAPRTGRVAYFSQSKGYGFINDSQGGERVFFHVSDLTEPIDEEDRVEFVVISGQRGPQASSIKKLAK